MLPVLALAMSGCQTLEDSAVTNRWRPAPLPRLDAKQGPAAVAKGTSLLRDGPVAEPTIVEGTGRFVGDRATTSQQAAAAPAEDGVTLNLVNVPVQQAANTILADILGVKYTVDPYLRRGLSIA